MIELLNRWIIGAAVVSLAVAVAETLVAQEGIRQVLRLAGGILLVVALLNPALFGDPAYYTTNMCLFYLHLGASLSYYNLAFWRIAPRTGWPELWAGMGRIATNLFSALRYAVLLLLATFVYPLIFTKLGF